MIDGMQLRRRLQRTERLGWRLAARAVFIVLFLMLAFVAVAANSIFTALLAAVLLGIFLRSILPERRLQSWARSYATGEAGDRWRRRYEAAKAWLAGVIPGL